MSIQEPKPADDSRMNKIDSMSSALEKAIKSRQQGTLQGHEYLVIDSKGQIKTTTDDTKASSMKKILVTLNELSEEILKDADVLSIDRAKIFELRGRLDTFIQQYEDKDRGPFGNLVHCIIYYVNNFSELTQQTQENLDKRLATYGHKKGKLRPIDSEKRELGSITTQRKSIAYATYANFKNIERKRQEQNINQLDKIKNSTNLSILRISKAFAKELKKGFPVQWANEKSAFSFVTRSFYDVLEQLTNEVQSKKISSEDVAKTFSLRLFNYLLEKNRYQEEIDRTTFKEVIGSLLGGKGQPADDINITSVDIAKLITDYKDKTWKENEERMLIYDIMDKEIFSKMEKALIPIIDSETFVNVLTNFFSQISKQYKQRQGY